MSGCSRMVSRDSPMSGQLTGKGLLVAFNAHRLSTPHVSERDFELIYASRVPFLVQLVTIDVLVGFHSVSIRFVGLG